MLFGTKLFVDENNALVILLRVQERIVLFSCKGKQISEPEIIEKICSNKTSMTQIKLAAKRGAVLSDDGMFLVPVTLVVTPLLTPEPEREDTEIWIPETSKEHDSALAKAQSGSDGPPAEQVKYLSKMHEMSVTTLGIVTKSANESLARVAEAQSEALRSMMQGFLQVQQSFTQLGSLPSKIFESSDQKVQALLQLAHQKAVAKQGDSAKPNDVINELKEIVGFVNTLKGAFE